MSRISELRATTRYSAHTSRVRAPSAPPIPAFDFNVLRASRRGRAHRAHTFANQAPLPHRDFELIAIFFALDPTRIRGIEHLQCVAQLLGNERRFQGRSQRARRSSAEPWYCTSSTSIAHTNYIRIHRRLLIAYVVCQPLEVSTISGSSGSPRVKRGGVYIFYPRWYYPPQVLAGRFIVTATSARGRGRARWRHGARSGGNGVLKWPMYSSPM